MTASHQADERKRVPCTSRSLLGPQKSINTLILLKHHHAKPEAASPQRQGPISKSLVLQWACSELNFSLSDKDRDRNKERQKEKAHFLICGEAGYIRMQTCLKPQPCKQSTKQPKPMEGRGVDRDSVWLCFLSTKQKISSSLIESLSGAI